jgi:AbrB family looped-hinge helix DNA binding protein
MTTMTVSSKGQMVLPANIRKRLGLIAGTQMEIIEEADGVRLVVARPIKAVNIAACAGMVTAPTKGKARSLSDFDPASMLQKKK